MPTDEKNELEEMKEEITQAVADLELGEAASEIKGEPVEAPAPDPTPTPDPEPTPEGDSEPIQEPMPESESEIAPKSAPPVISDDLLGRAVNAGISVADAQGLSPELLERIVKEREAAWKQRYEESISAGEAGDVSKVDEVEDPFAKLPKLDPDTFEPEVIKTLEQYTDILKQQQEELQELRGRQEETSQVSEAAATRDIERQFDSQVSKLGEDFSEALGTGGYSSLERGSSQLANREAIANQMSIMLSGYNAQGLESPPFEEVFDSAARLVLRDEYQKIHEKKLSKGLESQASQHIQRVGGQKASGVQTTEEEIAQALSERFNI